MNWIVPFAFHAFSKLIVATVGMDKLRESCYFIWKVQLLH